MKFGFNPAGLCAAECCVSICTTVLPTLLSGARLAGSDAPAVLGHGGVEEHLERGPAPGSREGPGAVRHRDAARREEGPHGAKEVEHTLARGQEAEARLGDRAIW